MSKKPIKYGATGFLLGGLVGMLVGLGFFLGAFVGAVLGAVLGQRAEVHNELFKKIALMRSEIEVVLADAKKIAKSKQLIRKWLEEKPEAGVKIPQNTVDAVFSIAAAYVQRTPNLMEALFQTAKSSNLESEIIYLLQTSLSYFEDPNDLLSDENGIAGLLDDAYLTQHLMEQVISWQGGMLARAVERKADLTASNAFVAALLPIDIVTALNQKVQQALSASEARQMLNRMMQQSAALQGNWSRASHGIDMKKEIVKDQIYSDLAKDGIYMRPTG